MNIYQVRRMMLCVALIAWIPIMIVFYLIGENTGNAVFQYAASGMFLSILSVIPAFFVAAGIVGMAQTIMHFVLQEKVDLFQELRDGWYLFFYGEDEEGHLYPWRKERKERKEPSFFGDDGWNW